MRPGDKSMQGDRCNHRRYDALPSRRTGLEVPLSEAKRLRELAANYLRLAALTSRDDMRRWCLDLAAETLETARSFERQEAQQPAQQQQQRQPKPEPE